MPVLAWPSQLLSSYDKEWSDILQITSFPVLSFQWVCNFFTGLPTSALGSKWQENSPQSVLSGDALSSPDDFGKNYRIVSHNRLD